jgi:hypothetical protein
MLLTAVYDCVPARDARRGIVSASMIKMVCYIKPTIVKWAADAAHVGKVIK